MQFGQLKRREVITLLGGAAVPAARGARAAARANATHRGANDDRRGRFRNRLRASLCCYKGSRNWAGSTAATCGWSTAGRPAVPTFVARSRPSWLRTRPDVILANGSGGTEPLLQVTRTLPIVFVLVPDPVAAGYVESLARRAETPPDSPATITVWAGNG